MKKIIIVIGTRPEAIKLIPVYLALKQLPDINVFIVSTGQHRQMLDQIFEFFNVRPDQDLQLMTHGQTLSQITALLYTRLDEIFATEVPDCVVVQGDTTTAMVAAMVSFYRKVKIAHVEAGLRSYDKWAPFPEEINRKIISQISDINFTPTNDAGKNLKAEGVQNIYITGNTVIDSLFLAQDRIRQRTSFYYDKFPYVKDKAKLVLVTAHRRENFGRGLNEICLAIKTLAMKYETLNFIFPVHLNPQVKKPVHELLAGVSNIKLIDPLGYDDMVFLMSQAYLILTDSGGIQEEAPSLNVPVIVLRDVTERPEGVESGCAKIGGTASKSIIEAFNKIHLNGSVYNAMKNAVNPYGDGNASPKIAEILKSTLYALESGNGQSQPDLR